MGSATSKLGNTGPRLKGRAARGGEEWERGVLYVLWGIKRSVIHSYRAINKLVPVW